jgi:hypothetical protein
MTGVVGVNMHVGIVFIQNPHPHPQAKFIPFSEASHLLSFADDRELVQKAFLLFEKTYPAK